MSSVYLLCLCVKGSHSAQQISASLVCAFPGPALILFHTAIYESERSTAQPQPWECWRFYFSVFKCFSLWTYISSLYIPWLQSLFPLKKKGVRKYNGRHLLFCPFCTVSWTSNLYFPCCPLHLPSLMLQSSLGFQSQRSVQCNLITKELESFRRRGNILNI